MLFINIIINYIEFRHLINILVWLFFLNKYKQLLDFFDEEKCGALHVIGSQAMTGGIQCTAFGVVHWIRRRYFFHRWRRDRYSFPSPRSVKSVARVLSLVPRGDRAMTSSDRSAPAIDPDLVISHKFSEVIYPTSLLEAFVLEEFGRLVGDVGFVLLILSSFYFPQTSFCYTERFVRCVKIRRLSAYLPSSCSIKCFPFSISFSLLSLLFYCRRRLCCE